MDICDMLSTCPRPSHPRLRPSPIDFAPMSDPEHENQRLGVLDPHDHAEVADPVSPKLAEALAPQRLTDRTGVIEGSDAVAKEAKNALGRLRIEVVEFARGGALELNPPRHGAG